MDAASSLREAVQRAGGRLDTTVRVVRDAFGLSRLTAAGRTRIDDELREADLRVEPPLDACGLDDPITIIDVRSRMRTAGAPPPPPPPPPSGHGGSAASDSGPLRPTTARAAASSPRADASVGTTRVRERTRWYRRRPAVIAGAIGAVVLVLAAAFGSGGDNRSDDVVRADVAPAAVEEPRDRGGARLQIEDANAAIAADDPDEAREILKGVDRDLIAEDRGLAAQVARSRRLARLTERYLEASALADAGALIAARREMREIAPFRNAGALAQRYGTRAANDLVAQARGQYSSSPGRALKLLDRAESLAPGLAAISTVRSLARERQRALATPPPPPPEPAPAPTPAPTPAEPSCDPNYTGACIPVVSYDLNCDDVSAVNFQSVGSDPHGFDREGDGWACES